MEIESKHPSDSCSGTGLSEKLKKETAIQHHQAETAPIQKALFDGSITKEDFCDFYTQLYHLHQAVEDSLDKYRSQEMWLDELFDGSKKHSKRLLTDLRCLGIEPMDAEIPDCCHEVDQSCPSEILGWLYTLEASMNGNKFLLERLKDNPILKEMGGTMTYLDPYGDHQQQKWFAFKHKIDEAPLNLAEQLNALEGAKKCFNAVEIFSYTRSKGKQ